LLLALPAMRLFRHSFPQTPLELMGRPERLSLVAFDLQADSIHSIDQAGMAYFYSRGESLPPRLTALFSSFEVVLLFGKDRSAILKENMEKAGAGKVILIPSSPPEGLKVQVGDYLVASLKRWGFKGGNKFYPLSLSKEALQLASDFYWQVGLKEKEKILAIHASSGSPAKNWPPQNFAAVANYFRRQVKILLISGPAEEGGGDLPRALKRTAPIIANNLPLIQLAALLQRCTAYLGNDSGITHLSAFLGIPTLAIFGPTDPAMWGPRGAAVKKVYTREACSPCSSGARLECQRVCMEKISPEQVIKIVAGFLTGSRLFQKDFVNGRKETFGPGVNLFRYRQATNRDSEEKDDQNDY